MDRAGLETMLMNYYRHIDRAKLQFDFLTHRAEAGAFDAEIKELGGRIYVMPSFALKNLFRYPISMFRFFRSNPHYTIIHSHLDAMSSLPLLFAKFFRFPVRIAHAHNNSTPETIEEAQLLQIPVIARSIGGIPDQIEEGVTGWLFEGDEKDCFNKIKDVIDNPEMLSQMRENLANIRIQDEEVIIQLKELFG